MSKHVDQPDETGFISSTANCAHLQECSGVSKHVFHNVYIITSNGNSIIRGQISDSSRMVSSNCSISVHVVVLVLLDSYMISVYSGTAVDTRLLSIALSITNQNISFDNCRLLPQVYEECGVRVIWPHAQSKIEHGYQHRKVIVLSISVIAILKMYESEQYVSVVCAMVAQYFLVRRVCQGITVLGMVVGHHRDGAPSDMLAVNPLVCASHHISLDTSDSIAQRWYRRYVERIRPWWSAGLEPGGVVGTQSRASVDTKLLRACRHGDGEFDTFTRSFHVMSVSGLGYSVSTLSEVVNDRYVPYSMEHNWRVGQSTDSYVAGGSRDSPRLWSGLRGGGPKTGRAKPKGQSNSILRFLQPSVGPGGKTSLHSVEAKSAQPMLGGSDFPLTLVNIQLSTCFMNVILQCLYACQCQEWWDNSNTVDGEALGILRRLATKGGTIDSDRLTVELRRLNELFSSSFEVPIQCLTQQDATEFANYTLVQINQMRQLHVECVESQWSHTCEQCHTLSLKDRAESVLHVPIYQATSVQEAVTQYFAREKHYDAKCVNEGCMMMKQGQMQRTRSDYIMTGTVTVASETLWIALGRTDENGVKITSKIHPSDSIQLNGCVTDMYFLRGVIVHIGPATSSGHYIAYIREAPHEWWKCNDHTRTKASFQDVLKHTSDIYMLVYSRRPIRQSSPRSSWQNTPRDEANNVVEETASRLEARVQEALE